MFYIISDIHGCHREMMAALSHWDKETEMLIVLGDLIDRGPDSLHVIQTLMAIQANDPDRVVILKGNHDESFTDWLLDIPEEELGFYYLPSHDETVQSFYGYDRAQIMAYKRDSHQERGRHLQLHFQQELAFLAELPMFYETDHCIFVHAGINLGCGTKWRHDVRCMNRIRNAFIYSDIPAPKRVFFGHTPTSLIRNQPDDHTVWINDQKDKLGIDGGCAFGGQLNAIKVNLVGEIVQTVVVLADQKENLQKG